MRAEKTVAAFDSASAMLRALSRFLDGRDFPALGSAPAAAQPLLDPLLGLANRLPRKVKESLYTWSGWREAVPAERLGAVRSEALAEWAVRHYPRRRYPAVLVGASNGAAVHLGAALGAPWLPHTLLIPVRRGPVHPDEPVDDLRRGLEPARALLDANPDLVLHQMHDPNQDRLMVRRMTYFRVKRLCLGPAYERFLRDVLAPGGTILLLSCGLRWPVRRVGERHVFQHGALGGVPPEEFVGRPPMPDEQAPEAEWGSEPAFDADVDRFAAAHGYRVRRLTSTQPEDLSPPVADLYRAWYADRGLDANRLLVESFILLEPYWTLRTGSVPFWMVFNTEPSLAAVSGYLDDRPPFDEIRMTLFNHGVESAGLVPIERWRQVLGRARKVGSFVGVDPRAYPRDFASLVRAHRDLAAVRHTVGLPAPLPLTALDDLLAEEAVGRG